LRRRARGALSSFSSLAGTALLAVAGVGCHDLSSFSTVSGGVYEGTIETAPFVSAGFGKTRMCLTIDPDHLQTAPGSVSTSDGLFHATPLRPIPQVWRDPLSTLTFGEGRIQNELYVADGAGLDGGAAGDVFTVVSFMTSGQVEVRLLRGAPRAMGSGPPPGSPSNLFGVFQLSRSASGCTF